MRKIYKAFILSFATLLLASCEPAATGKTVGPAAMLRIAPLPDEDPAALQRRYQPLLDFLKAEAGINAKLVLAKDYSHLLELFNSKQIDMANFGAATYLKAHSQSSAEALVMRDIDLLFTSVILVKKSSPVTNLAGLKNKSFVFGSKLSTSGHLMPRSFLKGYDIDPEIFFSSVAFSGAHDKTAYMVRDGKAYAGVMNASIARAMLKDGRLKEDELRILWETPQYPDYVWAIQKEFPAKSKAALLEAFLSLDREKPQHRMILDSLGANYYVATNHEVFTGLERILDEVNIKGLDK